MNDMIPKNFKIANSFKGMGGQLGQGIASSFNSIGIKRQVWSLKQGGEAPKLFQHEVDGTMSPLPYLDCVVLAENPGTSKVYFGGVYSEDSSSSPICQSANGIRPDPGVPDRQSPTCADCPHNEWGSAHNGGRGKACQDHKRLAILLMPYMTEDMLDKPLEEPVFLKVPPASLKPLKLYGDTLIARGIPPAAVVTRITWQLGKQSEMKFEIKQALTDKEAPRIQELLGSPLIKQIIGTAPALREALPEIEEPDGSPDEPISAKVQSLPRKGRPAGSLNKPKLIEATKIEEEDVPTDVEIAEEAAKSAPLQDTDTQLDDSVAKIMQKKMQNMLK